uniref:Putative antitoxin n=1 Tax=viral metagenome TaxID=1070528 RepID=A0A6H2A6E5_9ZZZZ
MSKSIKISDDVYERLQRLQGPRESYSEVIDRCMSTIETLKTLPLVFEREAVKRAQASREV